jgi:putative RecB family exonuclease
MSDTLAEQPPAAVLDEAPLGASGPGSSGADPAMSRQATPPAGLGIAAGATATGPGPTATGPGATATGPGATATGPAGSAARPDASPADASPAGASSGSLAAGEPAEGSEQDADVRITGPSLSPSRAADFMTCPLLYRFRVLDRLPEPPSPAAARGTLVHAVLERLFDEPAAGRTPAAARTLLAPQWERLTAEEPALTGLFDADAERVAWLDEAAQMLDRYFTLEDPTRIEPAHREMSVRTMLESGLTLRGYIDRLDIAPTGEIRIVDYKTGTAPREEYEARALFQMKFYAVVLWRTQGTIPRLLQLIYLGNGEIVRYAPDEADLVATERKINALWQAIDRARTSGDWRPRPSRLCDWCSYQSLCPVYGGTPPPLPPLPEAAQPEAAQPEAAQPEAAQPEPAVPAAAGLAIPAPRAEEL